MDAFDTILDPSNDDPSGFEPTKGKNFLMRRFKMYLKGRAYRLRSAEILIWNAPVLNEFSEQFVTNYTDILRIRIRTNS